MNSFNWESFLQRWSQAVLEALGEDQMAQLPQELIASGWLGYPGATEEQISQAEFRLRVKFPPSYREFLKVTNGWRQTTPFIRRLWSTDDIERFAVRHQKWIEAFINHHENTQVGFDDAIALDDFWESPSVSDAEYLIYGDAQDCSKLRIEYLKTAIEISDVGEASIYLLNPQVVTDEGEWEAWFFGDWLPGADRYPSFYDMMQAEYQNFLELRDAASIQSEFFRESETAAIAHPSSTHRASTRSDPAVLTPQTFADPLAEKPEGWRSLKRLIVEFQTRQMEARLEYRTITSVLGEPENAGSGLGARTLEQWLQAQLTAGMPSTGALATAPMPDLPPCTTVPVSSTPAEPLNPNLDLTLELDHLAIRQNSRLAPTVFVQPAAMRHAQKIASTSLPSQQPFALEVVFKLIGKHILELQTQPATYAVQCYAKSRKTGQWIMLGETRPDDLVSDRRTYKTCLSVNALEPGIYRLQVLTLLQGSAVSLTSFELPLLHVM